MARQHAEQFPGATWQDMGHQIYELEFRMVRAEVFWDGSVKGFRYEIHGWRKMRSKTTYGSVEVAKLQALRKLNDMINVEATRIKDALTSYIPF